MMRTCDKAGCTEPVEWTLMFRLGDPNFDFCVRHYAEARKVIQLWVTDNLKGWLESK